MKLQTSSLLLTSQTSVVNPQSSTWEMLGDLGGFNMFQHLVPDPITCEDNEVIILHQHWQNTSKKLGCQTVAILRPRHPHNVRPQVPKVSARQQERCKNCQPLPIWTEDVCVEQIICRSCPSSGLFLGAHIRWNSWHLCIGFKTFCARAWGHRLVFQISDGTRQIQIPVDAVMYLQLGVCWKAPTPPRSQIWVPQTRIPTGISSIRPPAASIPQPNQGHPCYGRKRSRKSSNCLTPQSKQKKELNCQGPNVLSPPCHLACDLATVPPECPSTVAAFSNSQGW